MEAGDIPRSLDGARMHPGSINLVLEVGASFLTPQRTPDYMFQGESYFLEQVRLRLRQENDWLPGLVWRNRPHPEEFNNLVEVITCKIEALSEGTKQHFEIEGGFNTGS